MKVFPSSFYTSNTGIFTEVSIFLLGTGTVFKYSNKEGPLYQLQIEGSTLLEILEESKALIGIKSTFSKLQIFFNQGVKSF